MWVKSEFEFMNSLKKSFPILKISKFHHKTKLYKSLTDNKVATAPLKRKKHFHQTLYEPFECMNEDPEYAIVERGITRQSRRLLCKTCMLLPDIEILELHSRLCGENTHHRSRISCSLVIWWNAFYYKAFSKRSYKLSSLPPIPLPCCEFIVSQWYSEWLSLLLISSNAPE